MTARLIVYNFVKSKDKLPRTKIVSCVGSNPTSITMFGMEVEGL